MNIVLGANGHVGSAVADTLLQRGEPVTVLLHDAAKAPAWQARGARTAVADVLDTRALRAVLEGGTRVFVLNPPAPVASDTDAAERATAASIVEALRGLPLQRVVAESTYGAQPHAQAGDLGVLYEMEQALRTLAVPTTIVRGAYYLSNWDAQTDGAAETGELHSFYPPDFSLPMVAPRDIGAFAASLMAGEFRGPGPHHVEGPQRYTPRDVAQAFGEALGREVRVVETPPAQWIPALRAMGFGEQAAASFAAMTEITRRHGGDAVPSPHRGATSLREHVRRQVATTAAAS